MALIARPSVCVVGAGAMGSLFGGLLAEGGLKVTLVDKWPQHVANVQQQGGLRMVGHGGDRLIPCSAAEDPGKVGPQDVVFFQCKSAHTEEAIKAAKPLFHDNTVAISFQNGLGNEEVIADTIGAENVLGGLTAQGASIEGPGVVRNHAELPSWIGEMSGQQSERVTHLAKVFSEHGLPTEVSGDIRKQIWMKLFANVAVSPMSSLTDMTHREYFGVEGAEDLAFALVDEALQVARAEGLTIGDDEAMIR